MQIFYQIFDKRDFQNFSQRLNQTKGFSIWKQLVLIIFLSLGFATASFFIQPISLNSKLPVGLEWIEASDAAELKNILWVDARMREEFEKEHIDKAVNVTLKYWQEDFESFAKNWRPTKTVVVYCGGGGCELSVEVGEKIENALNGGKSVGKDVENREKNKKIIYILKGGYDAWKEHLKK
jgi:rhodanese-related sulfurtransferase